MSACADPAKLAGIYPQKGCLQPGSDADIVVINPAQLHGVGLGNGGVVNSFAGLSTMGAIEGVYLRGQAVTATSEPAGRLLDRRVSLA